MADPIGLVVLPFHYPMLSTMTDKPEARISNAVADCLNACDTEFLPFSAIEKYVNRIKTDPTWSPLEIIEFQTRVIREILNRQALDGGGDASGR